MNYSVYSFKRFNNSLASYGAQGTRKGKSVTSTKGSAKQARKVTTPLVTVV